MNAEPIRDMRPMMGAQTGELAMIEFHTHLPTPTSMTSPEIADSWLEGQSPAVERLRLKATQAGRDGSSVVVVHGDSGCGKLRVAQWIHRCSHRSDRPLMVLDGASASLEHQLERVARTLVQSIDPAGTVAIRNFRAVPVTAIQRLLEILTIQGSHLRCGLILMTDRQVEELRAASLQHQQLLGRAVNSVIHVPALKQRGGDVAFLARRFVQESARRYGKQVRGISPQAIGRLENHDFPGNVHELRTLIEQAVLRSSGDWITAECFPGIGESSPIRSMEQSEVVIRLPGSSLREIEVQALRLALRLSGGRIVRASELLGITRHALRRKLEKFGLNDLRQQFEHGPQAQPEPMLEDQHI